MTWYAKGTFSNPAGSAVITGTGTEFATAKVRAGDGFIISNEVYEIKSVDSETQLTLVEAVATSNTNATYSIIPITGAVNSGAYIEGEVVKAVTNALRRDETYLIAFSNMLYDPTPAMIDVRLPDGTVISVPNWALATRAANTQDWADVLRVDMTAIQNDVKQRQADVTNKQTDVNTKATNAADSATLAGKWANNPEDSAVTPGKFSALHYAAKSAKSAAQADTDAQATAADRVQTAADRVQTGKDIVTSKANADAAAESAHEAAQYDPTKAVTLKGEIPAGDNISNYFGDVTHKGVWYKSTAGATVANGFPKDDFIGILEVFDVNGKSVQRAVNSAGRVYLRYAAADSYSSWVTLAMGGVNNDITQLSALTTIDKALSLSSTLYVAGSATFKDAVTITGATKAASFTGTDSNNFRIATTTKSVFQRFDSANWYLMLSDTPDGSYNSLRPITVEIATGNIQFGGQMTVGDTISCKDIGVSGNITLATTAQRRALAAHIGLSSNATTINIPASATQLCRVLSGSSVVTPNGSGEGTISFATFSSAPQITLSLGDGNTGMNVLAIINNVRVGSFDYRANNLNGQPSPGPIRINWTAIGLVNG